MRRVSGFPKKRNPEKTQRNLEMRLWRKNALERANNRCEWCGKEGPKGLNCHHIIDRRYKHLTVNDFNSMVLCSRCHKFRIGFAAHANPIRVYIWLAKHRPEALEFLIEHTKEAIENDIKNSNNSGSSTVKSK